MGGPVKSVKLLILTAVALGLVAHQAATAPARAITADLAKKCREMALKAHPPTRPGLKSGAAAEQRNFYQACLANGGSAPEDKPQSPAAAPAR